MKLHTLLFVVFAGLPTAVAASTSSTPAWVQYEQSQGRFAGAGLPEGEKAIYQQLRE